MAKKNRAKIGQLVLIEWQDSHYVPGWHSDEPCKEPLLCRSVGWPVYNGKEATTIASHMSVGEDPQRSGEMTIPTRAVLRVTTLD